MKPSSNIASSSAPPAPGRFGALWVIGARVVGIVATMAGNVIAAPLLGPAEFGTYLLMSTVIALGSILAMAGLNETGLRLLGEALAKHDHQQARKLLRIVLTLALGSSLAVGAAMLAGAARLAPLPGSITHSLAPAALLAVGMILLAWQQLTAELLRGFGDLRLASLFSGGQTGGPVSNLVFLAIAIGFLLSGQAISAVGLTLVMVGSILLTLPMVMLGLLIISKRELAQAAPTAIDPASLARQDSASDSWRQVLGITIVLLAIQVLNFLNYQLDLWLAGSLLSPIEVGLFGAAKRITLLAMIPVQMAMYATMAQVPRLHAVGKIAELQAVVRSSCTWAAIPAGAAIVILILFPRPVLSLVFGQSFADAAPLLLPLAIGVVGLIASGNPSYILLLTGQQSVVLAVHVVASAILAIGGVLGAKYYGASGLAIASATSVVVQNVALWWLAHQQKNIWTHPGKPLFSLFLPRSQAAELTATKMEKIAPASVTQGDVPVEVNT